MFITKFTQFIFPNEPQNEAQNLHKGETFAQSLPLSLFSFKKGSIHERECFDEEVVQYS